MSDSSTSIPTPTLGLAFGGGGMKGWAHVGVVSVLERYGLAPDVLAGCSAGAVTAAYLAAGYGPDEIAGFMRAQKTRALFGYRFDRHGLLSTSEFGDYLRDHLGDITFADLERPLYVSATDLHTGQEVLLSSGPVVEALLASCAMPGYFAPVRHQGRLLVDGGLRNNLPISALVTHGATFTVGVQMHKRVGALSPALRSFSTLSNQSALEGDGSSDGAGTGPGDPTTGETSDVERRVGLDQWVGRLRSRFRFASSDLPNALQVLERSMEILFAEIEGYRIQTYPPDLLITPRVTGMSTLSFSVEKETIFQCGVEAAEREADSLERLAALLKRSAST
ncbi:MAG: patatin-like phospholipase family protein [Bacteroidota bacterium]